MLPFRLDERWENASREILIFSAAIAVYNLAHKKFRLTHVDEDQQREYVRCIVQRMQFQNPFQGEVEFDVNVTDFEKDALWDSVKYSKLDSQRPEWNIPLLEEGNLWPLYNFCIGIYRLKQGSLYIEHASQEEALGKVEAEEKKKEKRKKKTEESSEEEESGEDEDILDDEIEGKGVNEEEPIQSLQEFYEASRNMPRTLKIYRYNQNEEPDNWNPKYFGPWPESGCDIYASMYPSINRSMTEK